MASPDGSWENSPERGTSHPDEESLQDSVTQWDSTSQVSCSSRRSSGTSQSSRTRRMSRFSQSRRSSRTVCSAAAQAKQKAKITAVWVRLVSEKRLAELRVQRAQAEAAIANKTKEAELRAVLEASLAEDEDEDDDEDKSSNDRRLKQHYSFPNVRRIEVEDGAGAYQVYYGLDKSDLKVVDNPSSSSQDERPHREEARRHPQEPRALQLGDGHGEARPKVLGGIADVPREKLGADQDQPSGGEHTSGTRAPQGPTDDNLEVHWASESEAIGGGYHPNASGGQDDRAGAPQTSEPGASGTSYAPGPRRRLTPCDPPASWLHCVSFLAVS